MTVPSLDQLQKDADAISAASPNTRRFAEDVVAYLRSLAPAPPPSVPHLFAADAWPNRRVPATGGVTDPNSAHKVSLLVNAALATNVKGLYVNGLPQVNGGGSTTYYHATATTAKRAIYSQNRKQNYAATLDPSWVSTPDSDHHLVAVRADGVYEEWQALDLATGQAHDYATGDLVNGDARNYIGNSISGLPLPAGLVLASEVAAGVIDHAVKGAIPVTAAQGQAGSYVWPAVYSDGTHTDGVPMGTRFIFPASVDLTKEGLDQYQLMLARAMQTHGYYISDSGGAVSVQYQSSADGSKYPFTSLTLPATLLQKLVVLAAGQ